MSFFLLHTQAKLAVTLNPDSVEVITCVLTIFLVRVVCVGGDGMFSEILHGLIIRTQTDNGVDRDRADSELVSCSLRMGIIPAGESATRTPVVDPGSVSVLV